MIEGKNKRKKTKRAETASCLPRLLTFYFQKRTNGRSDFEGAHKKWNEKQGSS